MDKKHPILIEMAGVCTAAGALTLKSEPLKPGDLLCVQRVAVLNNDTAATIAKIGFERAGLQVWLESITMTTAGLVYALKEPIWVLSDYRLVVVFSTAGVSKTCYVWGYGYLEER